MDDSDRNILNSLAHEACDAHCDYCYRCIEEGEHRVDGEETVCADCDADHNRIQAKFDAIPASQLVRCIRCDTPLTVADPAVTTLGPRCKRCW